MAIPQLALQILRYGLFAFGALFIFHGLYVTFIRERLLTYLGRKDVRRVSPAGIIGQIFVLAGAGGLRDQCRVCVWSAIILALMDPAGLHMFVAAMVYQAVEAWKRRDEPKYAAHFLDVGGRVFLISNVSAADDNDAIAQVTARLHHEAPRLVAANLFRDGRLLQRLDRIPIRTSGQPDGRAG